MKPAGPRGQQVVLGPHEFLLDLNRGDIGFVLVVVWRDEIDRGPIVERFAGDARRHEEREQRAAQALEICATLEKTQIGGEIVRCRDAGKRPRRRDRAGAIHAPKSDVAVVHVNTGAVVESRALGQETEREIAILGHGKRSGSCAIGEGHDLGRGVPGRTPDRIPVGNGIARRDGIRPARVVVVGLKAPTNRRRRKRFVGERPLLATRHLGSRLTLEAF